jgi:H+/gluconate symporter-like permease
MGSAARFLAQFFPIFILGAIFGKLMDDSRSVSAVADFMTRNLGERRASVVLAGAFVTYGGVSLFVAFFVLSPMAQALFRAAAVPRRLMPAAIVLGTSTFTMSAMPGTPSIQNAIPMPFFGTTPFAAPGLGIIASVIMLGCGLWWLTRAEHAARRAGEGYGTRHQSAPMRSMMSSFANERLPRANSIQRKCIMDITAMLRHRLSPRRCQGRLDQRCRICSATGSVSNGVLFAYTTIDGALESRRRRGQRALRVIFRIEKCTPRRRRPCS